MNPRTLIVVAVAGMALAGSSFAKTAGCPCSPCKCAPCTCGGGGSKSGGGGKHHDKEHGHGHHDHGGGGVGVGGTVDLGGIGHRNAEPDPFAAGGGEKPVAHTEEKRISKHKEPEPKTTSFDDIKLTGKEGKGDLPPQGTFNVNNDDVPKTTDAATELKKNYDKYRDARTEWLKKQPNYANVMHDLTQSPNTDEGNRKAAKAKKKFDKMIDQFNTGDGKQLVDDWRKEFDNVLKSGGTVDDNSMVPPPRDDIEKKKYAVIRAQNDLKFAQKNYDDIRQNAANKDEEVKKAQEALSNSGATSTNDPKYKAAVADLEKKVSDAGAKWAGTDEGKAEIKKVRDAEMAVDKAKEDWKPFEKYEDKKAASNQ